RMIDDLHRCAVALPFKRVHPVVEIVGPNCDLQRCPDDDPNRWLLIQANGDVKNGRYSYSVAPTHVIAFTTVVGAGCEPANFGLCRFPSTIEVEDRSVWPHRKKKLRTGLIGWRWGSFCKTQYASNPECGGVGNFLKCHLLVIRMLDRAKELGISTEVSDEGDFYTKRDPKALAKEVGEWNRDIAAYAGRMKDLVGPKLEAAIMQFPDFEHLEAEGRKRE
ncbi:MAG: hypothetical protein WCI73_12400, partial [Phycisphaerae bacterium]